MNDGNTTHGTAGILEGSVLYRAVTVAAEWIDRQWDRSVLSKLIAGAPERASAPESIVGKLAAAVRWLLVKIFRLLHLDKLLDGSLFSRMYFWCALAVFAAPILPTMVVFALAAMGLVSVVIRYSVDDSIKLQYSPVNKWICLFAIVYMTSTLMSVTPAASLNGGLLITFFALFAIVLQGAVKTEREADGIIWIMTAAGLLVSVYGIAQMLFGAVSTESWVDSDSFSDISLRVYSTLDNPNVLAEYLLLIIPLGVSCVFTAKSNKARMFALLSVGAMAVCMILTYSRGGWLGLIFAAAVFLVLIDRRFVILGIAALAVLLAVMPSTIMDRLLSIGDMTDSSTSYRVSIWLASIDMLKDYWFCGIGTGTTAFNAVYPLYGYNTASAKHAHSLYLQILCECGAVGLFALLGAVMSFIRTTASALARTDDKCLRIKLIAVISAVAGFLVQSATDYSFYNYRVVLIFWAVLAVGALLAGQNREKVSE